MAENTFADDVTIQNNQYLKMGDSGQIRMRYETGDGRLEFDDVSGNLMMSIKDNGTTSIVAVSGDLKINHTTSTNGVASLELNSTGSARKKGILGTDTGFTNPFTVTSGGSLSGSILGATSEWFMGTRGVSVGGLIIASNTDSGSTPGMTFVVNMGAIDGNPGAVQVVVTEDNGAGGIQNVNDGDLMFSVLNNATFAFKVFGDGDIVTTGGADFQGGLIQNSLAGMVYDVASGEHAFTGGELHLKGPASDIVIHTINTSAVIALNDTLGTWAAGAEDADETDLLSATIVAKASEAWGAGATGSRWEFRTTSAGSGSTALAMTIRDDKVIVWGVGGGLPGSTITAIDHTTALTISVGTGDSEANKIQVNSWSNIAGGSAANDPSVDAVPDISNDHITVTTAGVYEVWFSVSAESGAGAAFKLGVGLYLNNGTTKINGAHKHRNLAGGTGDEGSMCSGPSRVTLAAADTLELWLWNQTNTVDVTVSDSVIGLRYVEGV